MRQMAGQAAGSVTDPWSWRRSRDGNGVLTGQIMTDRAATALGGPCGAASVCRWAGYSRPNGTRGRGALAGRIRSLVGNSNVLFTRCEPESGGRVT